EYTAMGDAVNLAARMESIAEPGTILITDATRKALDDDFRIESVGPVEVKGKSEPVLVHRLLGLPEGHHPFLSPRRVQSPLVGREAEVNRLCQKISTLQENSGGICAVVGEAGLGKSRLVLEARQAEASDSLWAVARSLAYTQSTSYSTVRQLFTALLGGRPKDTPETLGAMIRRDLEERAPTVLPEVFPYLALMMGLSLEPDLRHRLQSLDPGLLQQRIYHAFRTYLQLRASEQPLVLVWEDFHWVDPSSLTVLESLIPMLSVAPILSVLTYRHGEERAENFAALARRLCGHRFETIDLKPLPDIESARLLSNLLGESLLSEDIRNEILRKTDGNAFFLEEVVRQ
ncbi:MAG: AAA family ATPase, partial [Proteobacteria bacterium]|nr:AAA family ATPase [Pseudomonadota bacterium]